MELLVRLIDRSASEADSHRGDVIAVQPDGWAWSQAELTNPDWLIIKTTDLLNTDRDILSSRTADRPDGRFRRRAWRLDLNNAPVPIRFTHPRRNESVNMTRLVLASLFVQKPALN